MSRIRIPHKICFVCDEEITNLDDAHTCHEDDCDNDEECTCDLWAHPDCCPDCHPRFVLSIMRPPVKE